MYNYTELKTMAGFYENELLQKFLPYWLSRCVDRQNGGFFTCYEDSTGKLASRVKYAWSQGRITWMFAKLADMAAPCLTQAQRQEFLDLSRHGARFILDHYVNRTTWRCVFLTDEFGDPLILDGFDRPDISVNADVFIAGGLAKYAQVSGDREAYEVAKQLFFKIRERWQTGDLGGYPYPVPQGYTWHGRAMTFTNIAPDLYHAAKVFEPELCQTFLDVLMEAATDLMTNFVDQQDLLHEVIRDDNTFFPQLMGSHINPGHTTEEAWFILNASALAGTHRWDATLERMVLKALELGWDPRHGGLVHFAGLTGGQPTGDNTGWEKEMMYHQLLDWDFKLWWVHSESLYCTLRFYCETGDIRFRQWYEKLFAYTYQTFPNPNPQVGEWINIRNGAGEPIKAVTSLPVKDPYHVIRDLALILELIYGELAKLG